jgi:uncharacterized membrane protein
VKTALFGRILFGASAVLFGVIALMWHDADTWQNLSRIWRLPFGSIAGSALMVAQIAGGLGIMVPRTARVASMVLTIVFAIWTLVCVTAIIAAPTIFGQYDSVFEQLSLFSGALAVFAVATTASRAATPRTIARLGFGVCTVGFTLAQIIYFRLTAELVPTWIPPSQNFWAILTTYAFGLAAVAILLNIRARLASGLLTLMLALFGILVWVPLVIAHPEQHTNWSEFALNFLITGAAWMVAESSASAVQ